MITAGIDCGARTTKAVILKSATIIGKGMVLTGFDQGKAVEDALDIAAKQAGIARSDIQRTFGTGSGKNAVKFADAAVNDIKAMARGAFYFFPKARTVADVGAEESRAAKLDVNGHPVDFATNEKCAAGAGAFIEAMARALEVTIEEIGLLCLQSGRQLTLNAQCAIFAESEVVGLIHARTAKPDISKAIHDAIASRIVSMIRRIGVNEDVILLGGLARNPGIAAAITRQLKVNGLYTPSDPEFGAAVGAALTAAEASN